MEATDVGRETEEETEKKRPEPALNGSGKPVSGGPGPGQAGPKTQPEGAGPQGPRPEVLARLSQSLRDRLIKLIQQKEPYLVLTGSDPEVAFGCCPSVEVGEAMRLSEAGFFQVWRQPAGPGVCQVSIFALAGEMKMEDGVPEFVPDSAARERLLRGLRTSPPRFSWALSILRISLFAFALFAISYFFFFKDQGGDGKELKAHFRIPAASGWVIFLFRQGERCGSCQKMAGLVHEALAQILAPQAAQGRISFKEFDLSQKEHRFFRKRYGLYTTALVISKVKDGEELTFKVLDQPAQKMEEKGFFLTALRDALTELGWKEDQNPKASPE